MKPSWWQWRARREWRKARTLERARRRRSALLENYKAGDPAVWKRDRGAALVETALVLPLLALLIAGGLGLGIAMVFDVRLTHASGQAAAGAADGVLEEDDVAAHIESAGGTLDCYWTGSGPGGCFDDGTEADRVQVVASTTIAVPFLGDVTPSAQATAFKGG